jgi:hypothetical protein
LLLRNAVILAWGLIAPALSAQAVASITVGKNVHVSTARAADAHEETWLGADPTDPKRLLGCSMVHDDSTQEIYVTAYLSMDGGLNWENPISSRIGHITGDPVCAFGPNGHAYLSLLGQPGDSSGRRGGPDLYLYSSADGGKSWGPPVLASRTVDREGLVVDRTGGRYNGRIYMNAVGPEHGLDDDAPFGPHQSVGIHVFRSVDEGKSFVPATPTTHLRATPPNIPITGNGVILSDGTYVFVYSNRLSMAAIKERRPKEPNTEVRIVVSGDGGDSFGGSRLVSESYTDYAPYVSTILPTIAVDASHSAFNDRLYVVWPDVRSGRSQILFSYSADTGKTWSTPITVDDDRAWDETDTGPNDIQPALAVNRDGVVGVTWYDRREHKDNLGYTVRFAASFDGGETFTPSVRVSEVPNLPYRAKQLAATAFVTGGAWHYGKTPRSSPIKVTVAGGSLANGGDTGGLAASADGVFHPFWIDNRTGILQVWTAAVATTGSVALHGGHGLESMQDVTKRIALEVQNVMYDQTAALITFDLVATNRSSDAIAGPLKVRILRPRSAIGDPVFQATENSQDRSGALLSLPVLHGRLEAGDQSGRVRVTARLEHAHPLDDPPRDGWRHFIQFDALVYAPHSK